MYECKLWPILDRFIVFVLCISSPFVFQRICSLVHFFFLSFFHIRNLTQQLIRAVRSIKRVCVLCVLRCHSCSSWVNDDVFMGLLPNWIYNKRLYAAAFHTILHSYLIDVCIPLILSLARLCYMFGVCALCIMVCSLPFGALQSIGTDRIVWSINVWLFGMILIMGVCENVRVSVSREMCSHTQSLQQKCKKEMIMEITLAHQFVSGSE